LLPDAPWFILTACLSESESAKYLTAPLSPLQSGHIWDWHPLMSFSGSFASSGMGSSFLLSPMTYSYLSVQS